MSLAQSSPVLSSPVEPSHAKPSQSNPIDEEEEEKESIYRHRMPSHSAAFAITMPCHAAPYAKDCEILPDLAPRSYLRPLISLDEEGNSLGGGVVCCMLRDLCCGR